MKRIIIFILPLSALAVGIIVAGWYATNIKPITEAKDAVRKQLTDPDSAKFRNVKITVNETICGEVNAKNKKGKYEGFRYFYFSSLTGERTIWIDSDTFNLSQQMCTNK